MIETRRSVRHFREGKVPPEVIRRALDLALLAPNSSNAQTWDFYWVRNPDKRQEMNYACLGQRAATTASEILVVTANRKKWLRSWERLKQFNEAMNAPGSVKAYYKTIFPRVYRHKFFNLHLPIKKLVFYLIGLVRPVPRWPLSNSDLEELCIKSAALAAENFVLAITAQGYASCMMEGFDEWRIRKILGLTRRDRIVMVIGVGEEDPKGKWGPRFRLPREEVIHEV